jgi:hypothetical protein
MSNEQKQEHAPGTRRKQIPLSMAKGPQDYVPGQQEEPAVLTNFAICSSGCKIGHVPAPSGPLCMHWRAAALK